jgi:hypothetical protein
MDDRNESEAGESDLPGLCVFTRDPSTRGFPRISRTNASKRHHRGAGTDLVERAVFRLILAPCATPCGHGFVNGITARLRVEVNRGCVYIGGP